MFWRSFLGAAVSVLFFSSASLALTFADGYVGGTPTNSADIGKDVIGIFERYDISELEVTIDSGILQIKIVSQFFDNVGVKGIELGDLFLSVDGWNPFGAAPYVNDNATNGEDWEIVFVLDDHGAGVANTADGESYIGKSGLFGAFFVNPASIELTDLTGEDFRSLQEFQYNPARQAPLTIGLWEIVGDPSGPYSTLIFYLFVGNSLSGFDPLNFGFHWTMECGNDVIEGGGAAVPEPSSLILLGAAMAGIMVRQRKHRA